MMAEYIERAAAVKVVLRERKPTNSVAQNRMLSIIQRDLLTMRAAYEDTGLEPEEVLPKDKADEIALKLMRLADLESLCNYTRLRELAEADKDGRLVVLPCKVDDGLWTFCSHPVEQVYSFTVTDISTLNGRTMLNTSRCGVVDARDVGKTVFLTREEAEKALEAMK
jgi:hypothetical protein